MKQKNIMTLKIDNAKSELPPEFKDQIDTFVIKSELTCGANLFMNILPLSVRVMATLTETERANPNIVGRHAFEELTRMLVKTQPDIETQDLEIQGREKNPIKLRWYKGQNTEAVILFAHGGGWVRGSLDTHDRLCREIGLRTGFSVLAVDYRLAPENPYPAGLNDVEDAFEWVINNHGQNSKILFSGDSAGGNLLAGLTLKKIEDKNRAPDGLLLLYPALDLEIPKITDDPMADGYFLTRNLTNYFIKVYLGLNFRELAKDPKVSPIAANAEILKALPPTLILAGEFDPLTQGSQNFTKKANDAGANVELVIIEKTIHIFAQYPDLFAEADLAFEVLAKWARRFSS